MTHWLKAATLALLIGASAGAADEPGKLNFHPTTEAGFSAPYGHVIYLPPAYGTNTSARFPLIISMGGTGERGNGSTDLARITNHGPLARIKAGSTFFADNPTIVMSFQVASSYNFQSMDQLLTYMLANYRVDPNRVHLTGLSLGGGATWNYAIRYAHRLASIVPVCGSSYPFHGDGAKLVGLPVWAHHYYTDPTVPTAWTDQWASAILAARDGNGAKLIASMPYTAIANAGGTTYTGYCLPGDAGWRFQAGMGAPGDFRFTIYPLSGHGGWSQAYGNDDTYRWMLSQVRSAPFGGTPAAVPGVLEAERFDTGGQGSGFHNTTPATLGAARTTEAADTVLDAGCSGGQAVDLASGEWLRYTVEVASAGRYRIDFSVPRVSGSTTLTVSDAFGASASRTITAPGTTAGSVDLDLRPGLQRLTVRAASGSCRLDALCLRLVTDAAARVVVDNCQARLVTSVGSWTASAADIGYWGCNYVANTTLGQTGNSVAFAPVLPRAGKYKVSLRWTASSTRDAAVPVEVVHAGGTARMTVDMRSRGGAWNALGSWTFAEGRSASVTIRTNGTSGAVIADAVCFDEEPATTLRDLVIDNRDTAQTASTGTWQAATVAAACYGADYRFQAAGGTGTWSFTPALSRAGTFDLMLWHPRDADRDKAVPVEIVHAGGRKTVYVDMSSGGGAWKSLGVFDLGAGAGHGVTIRSEGTTRNVLADALRLREVAGPANEPVDIVLDNSHHRNVAYAGTWGSAARIAGFFSGDYRWAFGNAVDTTCTYTPEFPRAARCEVFLWYPAASDRPGAMPVDIMHGGGTASLRIDQRVQGGAWRSLGIWNFAPGKGHGLRIRCDGTSGYVTADAVRFVEVPPGGAG